jgi:hypothetical protein
MMDTARYNRLGQLERWLEQRHQRACDAGDSSRALRYADLMSIVCTKLLTEAPCGITTYSDFD